jgi:polysaccharide export outer membrane protein
MCYVRFTVRGCARRAGRWLAATALCAAVAGCSNKLLDPTQVGRFRPTPAVNGSRVALGVAEETPVAWAAADEPRPQDIVVVQGDYTLRTGDMVRISIFELFQEGTPMVNDYVVSETGKLSIPEVGVMQAAGLTETQLEQEIRRALSPGILKTPSVTVTLMNSQQRTFSILGNGVPQPGRYGIPRYDFRLTDALATAGGPMQFNVSHIYVARAQDAAAATPAAHPARPDPGELELVAPGPTRDVPLPAPAVQPPAPLRVPQGEIPIPSEPAEKYELEREMLDLIAPSSGPAWPATGRPLSQQPPPSQETVSASVLPPSYRLLVPEKRDADKALAAGDILIAPTEFGTASDRSASSKPEPAGRVEWVFRNGQWVPITIESTLDGQPATLPPEQAPAQERRPQEGPAAAGQADGIEWVLENGQWIPVEKGRPRPATPTRPAPAESAEKRPPKVEPLPMDAEWEEAVQTRLMKVPADKLLAGDPRYNVVIKPGDTIYVPVDLIGEFCIMGNVNRAGFIGLTGRPMTLKMAIAAAGGLGPLAYPKYCEVVRRLGGDREQIVMVDLDKIASGEQPDFFIKPNDLINVGTHPTSRWRATLRNAFRAAYGFAFVYDRNFVYADDYYGTSFF